VTTMTRDAQISLVQSYFSGVDGEDLDQVLATLTEDCRFSVETHGVALTGHAEIGGMMQQLWSRHKAVLHDNFHYVCDPENGTIAARFRVTNTLQDGTQVHKSNCNFFTIKNGKFDTVAVYMAGENTLERKV
jgi:ketosteroid isomerase-like protein